jgi:hypothetical protein
MKWRILAGTLRMYEPALFSDPLARYEVITLPRSVAPGC